MKVLRGIVKLNDNFYRIHIVIEGPKKPAQDIADFLAWVLHRKGVKVD